MKNSLYEYCIERDVHQLLDQWDKEKNAPLTPQDVSFGSHTKIWWNCGHGHQWSTTVYSRTTNKTGCPYCHGRSIWHNEHTLAIDYPDIAKQWHPVKNHGLLPDQVLPGTHRKVWWICENGHEWDASIRSRVKGTGCPYCTNRKIIVGENDLQTTHPELAAEWHPSKNGVLTPQQVVSGTIRKVWWRCGQGHEWKASINSRACASADCPYCKGKRVIVGENDLQTSHPEIAAQWHPTLNGSMTPQSVSSFSNRKAWWICDKGHEYQSQISSRTTRQCGCPYCSGRKVLAGFNDLQTLEPKVAAQWHPSLNGSLTPEMVTTGSHTKVWWQCSEGHVWKAVVHSRARSQKTGCPVCAGKYNPKKQYHYKNILLDKNSMPVSFSTEENDLYSK